MPPRNRPFSCCIFLRSCYCPAHARAMCKANALAHARVDSRNGLLRSGRESLSRTRMWLFLVCLTGVPPCAPARDVAVTFESHRPFLTFFNGDLPRVRARNVQDDPALDHVRGCLTRAQARTAPITQFGVTRPAPAAPRRSNRNNNPWGGEKLPIPAAPRPRTALPLRSTFCAAQVGL